jgi:hypothetical protein
MNRANLLVAASDSSKQRREDAKAQKGLPNSASL